MSERNSHYITHIVFYQANLSIGVVGLGFIPKCLPNTRMGRVLW